MYLKSLKLVGFKSFADRGRLEFRPGVTVVVGPNGSGKSNLVEALSWVLGTQSTKALRTAKMEDVIFAGTATRPALNRAEVVLVVDNTERRIDLDLDEISLTRRLYRDGSSDYELNGVPCRLLDIQDLLSDTGVGKHQHVIIGQGEIERVLAASPEDHRAVIEEAAGILKHRRRKERAERRLERTDDDMVRLRDLLGEIERQMRPLRRQAKAAQRYDGLKSEVRGLRLYLGGVEMARYDRELEAARAERSELASQIDSSQTRIDGLSRRLTQMTGTVTRVGADLDRDTSAAALLETTMERLRRSASVAHERRRALMGRQELTGERRADLVGEKDLVRQELEAISSEREAAAQRTASAEARFRALEDEERSLATQKALSPEGALAEARGRLSALQSAMQRDRRERKDIGHRLDVLQAQAEAESTEVARINAEIQTLDSGITSLQESYQKAKRQRLKDQEVWGAAEETLLGARSELASAQARLEAVQAALAGRFDREAWSLAESAPGALGSLLSQLDVSEELGPAVEAALGSWAHAVALGNMEAVRSVVAKVKAVGRGAVPLVSALSPAPVPARQVAARAGVEALIDRLGPYAHAGLATRLLGDVLLVDGWATGWDLIAKHPALRAVTPEGDLITVSGVFVASLDGQGGVMLEEAEVAAERAATALARAESRHGAAQRDFTRSREAERSALEALESAEADLAGHSEAMARLQRSVDSIQGEAGRLKARKDSLDQALGQTQDQIDDLEQRLRALEGEEAERMKAWENLEEKRLSLSVEKEKAGSEWHEAEGELRGVIERERLLQQRLDGIEAELEMLDRDGWQHHDPEVLEAVAGIARRGLAVLDVRLQELRNRQAELRDQKTRLDAQLEVARSEHDSLLARLETSRKRVAELDVRLTELRLQREAVVESIRRDADSEPEVAIGAPRPDIPHDADLHEMLRSKLEELRRLGPVNPLAAEEYATLEERHSFLTEQMADVEASRSELRKVSMDLLPHSVLAVRCRHHT